MADKIISATLKLNTGQANQEIKEVNENLDKTSQQQKKINEGAKENQQTFSNLKDGLSKLPGPMQGVTKGIETVQTSLKALAANPIVLVITLLVAALVALYKAFASTEEGAEKIEQVMSGLSAAFHVIIDRVLKFAGAIVSFFKGDFAEAAAQAKEAVTGLGDAIVEAYSKSAQATKDLQEAEDEKNRVLDVARAKLNRDLARSKELISDENASYAERRKALDAVRIAQQKQAEAELKNAEKTLNAKKILAEQDKNNADKLDEYTKAQADFYALQQQQAADERNINKQEAAIEKKNQADIAEANKEAAEKKKAAAADLAAYEAQLLKLRQENELAAITDSGKKALAQIQINLNNELAAIQKQLDEKHIKQEQAENLRLETQKKYDKLAFDQRLKDQMDYQAKQDKEIEDRKKKEKEEQDQAAKEQKERDDYQKKIDEEDNAATIASMKKFTAQLAEEEEKRYKINVLFKKLSRVADSEQVKAIQATANTLSELFGKQTAAGKIFAIASATIDTFRSAVASYAGMVSAFPGPVGIAAGVVAAAASVALGLKNIKQIVAVKVPGGGGSGAVPSAPDFKSPEAPVAPIQQGTTIDQNSITGIGNAVNGRTYVLSQDVTHDQDRNERLNRAARLGG